MASRFADLQVALRRMCFDGKGNLHRDARLIAADLRKFCRADGRGSIIYSPTTGQVDPVATAAMAARRDVYDRLRRLLNLDDYVESNLRDES